LIASFSKKFHKINLITILQIVKEQKFSIKIIHTYDAEISKGETSYNILPF